MKPQYWNSEKSSMGSFDMERGIRGNRNMFMEIFDHFKPQIATKFDIRDTTKYLYVFYWNRSKIKYFDSLLIWKYFGFECRMNVFHSTRTHLIKGNRYRYRVIDKFPLVFRLQTVPLRLTTNHESIQRRWDSILCFEVDSMLVAKRK